MTTCNRVDINKTISGSLSYTITGGAALLKSCRQKHGGFRPLLTPDPRHWSEILLRITTGQLRSCAANDVFAPLVFGKIVRLSVFCLDPRPFKMPSFALLKMVPRTATVLFEEEISFFTGKMHFLLHLCC